MAISFVEAEEGVFDGTDTISIDHPSLAAEGDVLIAFIGTIVTDAVVTPPAGWTSRAAATGAGSSMEILEYTVGGSPPASHDFTVSNVDDEGRLAIGAIVAYRGATRLPTVAVVESLEGEGDLDEATYTTDFGTSHDLADINPERDASWILMSAVADDFVTWTSNITERVDMRNSANAAFGALFVGDVSPEGAPVTGKLAGSSASTASLAVSIELYGAGPVIVGLDPATTPGGIGLVG